MELVRSVAAEEAVQRHTEAARAAAHPRAVGAHRQCDLVRRGGEEALEERVGERLGVARGGGGGGDITSGAAWSSTVDGEVAGALPLQQEAPIVSASQSFATCIPYAGVTFPHAGVKRHAGADFAHAGDTSCQRGPPLALAQGRRWRGDSAALAWVALA